MKMKQEDLGDDVLLVTLDGAFDIAGAGDVDLPFSVIAGSRDKVIVDFSDVSFLASIGIRVIVKTAKSMANRGGKLMVANPNQAARKVLASTGVDTIVGVTSSIEEARAELA